MSCSVYLEYTRRAEVSAVAKSASDFMQRLLRLRNRPTIEGWSMDGYDWILMRPILVTPKRFLDEARAIFTTCDREAFSHVTYDAEFPLTDVGVPVISVELEGAREPIDVALAAAVTTAIAYVVDTLIVDFEGCFRGPRQETWNQFLERTKLEYEPAEILAGAEVFATSLARRISH